MSNVSCQDGMKGARVEKPNLDWHSFTLDRTEHGCNPRIGCVSVRCPWSSPGFACVQDVGSLVGDIDEFAILDHTASCFYPVAP